MSTYLKIFTAFQNIRGCAIPYIELVKISFAPKEKLG